MAISRVAHHVTLPVRPRYAARALHGAPLRLGDAGDRGGVWLVDDEPIARVSYPHEVRWPLKPGRHTIRARLAKSSDVSEAVTVVVDD